MDDNMLADDLAAYLTERGLSGPIPDADGDLPPVGDDQEASRLLRRKRRLLEERADIVAQAKAEIEPIREWETDRLAGVDAQIGQIDRNLEGYCRMVNAADPEKTSWNLPQGRMQLAGRPPFLVVYPARFTRWALDNRRFDLLNVAPRKDALRKEIAADRYVLISSGDEPELIAPDGDEDSDRAVEARLFLLSDRETGERIPGAVLARPTELNFHKPKPSAR